jgi:hypothetical protein
MNQFLYLLTAGFLVLEVAVRLNLLLGIFISGLKSAPLNLYTTPSIQAKANKVFSTCSNALIPPILDFTIVEAFALTQSHS